MAITNFIPAVWSENLYKQLEKKYIGVANCTREWEGDIKECGDRVKICGLGPVSIFNYQKDTDLPAPITLEDNCRELIIDQADAFNFQIDDIDLAQSKPGIMNAAISQAADALADKADSFIYSLVNTVTAQYMRTMIDKTEEELVAELINLVLEVRNSGVRDELILEVSPVVAGFLYKAKLGILSDNNDLLETGCIGSIAGCKIYSSHNIKQLNNGSINMSTCILRTKRAVAFAEQVSEIEAYRPELRFADAVKGLHLYGAKIVRPEEFYSVNIGFSL